MAQEQFVLTELDLALINALQVNPRAPWTLVGSVLGVDPVTVARRWQRLRDSGAAWVTIYPLATPSGTYAFVEVVCQQGRTMQVAHELARDPQAVTIDVTIGGRDLVITASAPSLDALSWYLLTRLPRVEHIVRVRSHLIIHPYTEASRWQLRSLDREQVEQLKTVGTPPATVGARREPKPQDWALAHALSLDGRFPLNELADFAGISASTARRRLDALISHGNIRLRCEVARELSGWPVSAWLLTRVPAGKLDETARRLATMPDVRSVTSTAGPQNLWIAVWLRKVVDVQALETHLATQLPHLDVVDRSVVIRPYKLVGRLLDRRGFAVDAVHLDTRAGLEAEGGAGS